MQFTLDFLRDLRDNNEREWFNANRDRYEVARGAYKALVAAVIDKFDAVDDLGGVSVEETMFRINRDTRFSPDKTPYKVGMGALLGKEGRKSTGRTYYVHVEPGGSFVAGGLYRPEPQTLERVRQAIADDDRPLRAILAAEPFKQTFGEMRGEQLKTAPKGYDKTHHAIDLLRYKQFIASRRLSDAELLADDLADQIVALFMVVKPFVQYLDEAARS